MLEKLFSSEMSERGIKLKRLKQQKSDTCKSTANNL